MKFKSVLLDCFNLASIDYLKFYTKKDDYHLELTFNSLKKYETSNGLIKEFDIFNRKSKEVYLKSSGYYILNLKTYNKDINHNFKKAVVYSNNSINDYFNSAIYILSFSNPLKTPLLFEKQKELLAEKRMISPHKELFFSIINYQINLQNEFEIIDFIIPQLNKELGQFVKENSFVEGSNNGSSHEFGYWLNYLLDFYERSKNETIKNKIKPYFEQLHNIFVSKKMFYHDVIGKDKKIINISGVLLMSKAFIRFSLLTKDFRFFNAALFLIDFVKSLQLRNKGFIQNTFPIYRGNSKMKFPSWVLNYMLEVLNLKKKALDEFENSIAD